MHDLSFVLHSAVSQGFRCLSSVTVRVQRAGVMVPDRYWTLLWAAETRGARPLTVVMEFSQLMTCRFDLSASPSGVSGVGALELEQRSSRPRRAETKKQSDCA